MPPIPRRPAHRRARVSCKALASAAVLATLLATPLAGSAQKPPPLGAPDAPRGGRSDGGDRGGDPGNKPGKPPPLGAPDEPGPRGGSGGGRSGGSSRLPFFGERSGDLPGEDERPASTGTGFAVAPGRLMTNNHVVEECNRMVARNTRGQRVVARVDNTDRRRDLALLTVQDQGFAPPLTFRSDPPLRRGETVVTYGFPLSGLLSSGPTLTTGDVSALSGLRNNPINLQISAPVQPGNSGGPLLDLQANVVGVVVSKLNAARIAQMTGGDIPQNVNFAVKGTEALGFLRQNGVQPRTATSGGTDKRSYEVGEIADASTVFLQCYR